MKLFSALIALLYPRKCPFCRRVIPEERLVCRRCEKTLTPIPTALMPRRFPALDGCYSLFRYENTVRDSLLRYKFHGAAAYSETYGKFLAKYIDENQIFCDIVTWVPVSRKRKRQRGYDQSELMARELSSSAGLDCEGLLKKIRHNRAQSTTEDADMRRKNVSGAYAPVLPERIRGSHILLIDDIVTTGSTLSECASVLKEAGAESVIALTLAATMRQ